MTASAREAPLIVIAGPTASGKTGLAVRLAEELGGEIVSCDSVAVYRLMDIGSAKASPEDRARVLHHCLDIYWPDEFCTAGDYARHARTAIMSIRERERIPIVAGGTGLYLRALLHGLAPAPPRNESLRERLRIAESKHGPGYLHRLLRRMDGHAAQNIHANDIPKLIRSIEVTIATRTPQTEQWRAGRDALQGFRTLQLGLSPVRDQLYRRINERAAGMFERGLTEETDMLRKRFGENCRSLQALGYAQALNVLNGELSTEQAIAAAQQGHRNYAKRQLTWFRREPDMKWLPGFGDDDAVQQQALELAASHVHTLREKHA